MNQLAISRHRLVSELIGLLTREGPMRLVAVTGPRQAGKTHLVRQMLEERERKGTPCWYFSMDSPASDVSTLGLHVDFGALIPGCPREAEWLVAT